MTGILFGLTVLIAGYLADLVAHRWGFRGEDGHRLLQSLSPRTKRNTSRTPNGQPRSAWRLRRTGMRSA